MAKAKRIKRNRKNRVKAWKSRLLVGVLTLIALINLFVWFGGKEPESGAINPVRVHEDGTRPEDWVSCPECGYECEMKSFRPMTGGFVVCPECDKKVHLSALKSQILRTDDK
jgi:ssDNA-binding Zn-finger/Zn-ribbon topoisomerase 1